MTKRMPGRSGLTDAERDLLDGLVRDVAPRLMAYVRRVYGNPHEAEDIVAEAFCRAAQNIKRLQESDRPDLYLITTTRNLCRDRFRRRRPTLVPSEQLDQRGETKARPGDIVHQDETATALRAAVAELPEPLREVVVLRLSGDLKFDEIARMLDIPLGTALSRMHSAVAKLRERIGAAYEPST